MMLLGLRAEAAETGKGTEPAQDLVQLQARLTKILNDTSTPGMGVIIADRRGILWSAGIGLADVAAARPATSETLFRVGSISKLFVALAVLKLVEEGRLRLETPVKDLVPDIAFTNRWEATDPIRVAHLLEHTTGWDEIHPKEIVHDDPNPVPLAEGLALGRGSRVSRWRPGTRHAYSNSGPAVAAAIVEKLTGKRFEAYVKEAFFDALGMPSADYFDGARTGASHAKLYRADGRTPLPYRNFALRPSSSLNASAREMGAALLFFLRRGQVNERSLLAEASIRRMETPATSYGAEAALAGGYGLCNGAVYDDRAFVWRGHTGAMDGARSELYYLPEQGVGFFFAINSGSDQALGQIGLQLTAYLTKGFAPAPLPPAYQVPADVSRGYAGWYVPANPQLEVLAFMEQMLGLTRLSFHETGLVSAPLFTPAVTATAVDGTRFRNERLSVANIAVVSTPEGRAVVWGQSVFLKISAVRAWAQILFLALLSAALVSVPLLTLGGGVRWIVRRAHGVPFLPLVAWLSALAAALLAREAIRGGEDAAARFGRATAWSLGLTAATWAFAASSVAALLAAAWTLKRRDHERRLIDYHSLAVAILFVIATLYLGWHGIVGYRKLDLRVVQNSFRNDTQAQSGALTPIVSIVSCTRTPSACPGS